MPKPFITFRSLSNIGNVKHCFTTRNDIIDVNKEWPKSQEELVLYVKDKYGANNSSDIHHYVLTADRTIVVDWDATKAVDGTYTALTNLEYEEEVNDKKRQIKVLNPIFLSTIAKQFKLTNR